MVIQAKDIKYLNATELAKLVANKEISAKELVDVTYKNIDLIEPKIDALNSLTKELAYSIAETVDSKIKNNEKLPPLAGVPVAIKDNMCIKNCLATCSSKILEDFYAPYTSTVAQKVIDNLLIPVAKTNLDEFAMGSSTENSGFKTTKNPWDLNKVPGGSSGGSAASVASGQVSLSLGSDTGGSIRLPASFCGVAGMKPTYGLVSRYGLIAYASSLDQIGPFARNITDLSLLLQVIAGYDHKDSTSINKPVPDYSEALKVDIKNFKIGILSDLIAEGVQPEVKSAIESVLKLFKENGAQIDEVTLPHQKYAIATYYIIAPAECSANLARYDGVKYGIRNEDSPDLMDMYLNTRKKGFGDEVKRRIMLGTYALSSGYYDAYYKKAQQVRALIKQDFDNLFEKYDLLVSPACPNTAFDIGSRVDDPLTMYLTDIATVTANLAGIPGISIPCGFDSNGLPIGLQILAPVLQESKMLQAAYTFEQLTDYNRHFDKIKL
ncbi:MAG: Asp-tRNA(Asn)/Glu-tRNA(Gln) amidotransferase subunit GatA [Cyanobacteriota bacterium]